MDSVLWRSSAAVPPLDRVLGFDAGAGSIAAVDRKGAVIRIDLRLATVTRQATPKLARLSSADGWSVYGVASDGGIVRLTPSDTWPFRPPSPASEVIPQPDGTVLILANREARTTIWQMHPPVRQITDTAVVPRARRAIPTIVGDRLYLVTDSGLIGVRGRDLARVPKVPLPRQARSIATTPSGDRIYIVTEGSQEVTVVDRYSGRLDTRIKLPATAIDLRMDATGRFVLVRAATGDTAWVVDIGTDRVIGSAATAWRADLPTVAPDGAILLLRGKDVVILDGETLRQRRVVQGGGSDRWMLVAWDGLRARSRGEVEEEIEELLASDRVVADTAAANPFEGANPALDSLPPVDTAPRVSDVPAVAPPPSPAPSIVPRRIDSGSTRTSRFTVQFAALRDQRAAHVVSREVNPAAGVARVLATQQAGVTIYRVYLGPFSTRAEAERAARASGRSYWIYEGAP